MRSLDRDCWLVLALISFCSSKKDRSAPNSVERQVLCQPTRPPSSVHYPSGVPPSVRLSVFRWASRPPSGSPSSARRSAICRPLRLLLGIPSSVDFSFQRSVVRRAFRPLVEIFALRQALRLPSGVPTSVGLPILCWAIRLPSGVLPSIGVSTFCWTFRRPSSSSFRRSVVR